MSYSDINEAVKEISRRHGVSEKEVWKEIEERIEPQPEDPSGRSRLGRILKLGGSLGLGVFLGFSANEAVSASPDREVITGEGVGTPSNPFPPSHFDEITAVSSLTMPSDTVGTDELAEDLIYGTEKATGTITATGGSSPAYNGTIAGVSADQLEDFIVVVKVDSDPAFSSDYAFNKDVTHYWDDSDGEIDIVLTVNWDTDPGAGNDVTLRYRVIERT